MTKKEKARARWAENERRRAVRWLRAAVVRSEEICRAFPLIPRSVAFEIARFATTPGSGRVLRHSGCGEVGIVNAVAAHVRHTMTDYDLLMVNGFEGGVYRMAIEREEARKVVRPLVAEVLARWGYRGQTPCFRGSKISSFFS